MVALNPDFAPSKTETDAQNRVGGFFSLAAERVVLDQSPSRNCTGENELVFTMIVSGRPFWLSRDPIAEDGGLNLYGFNYNAPTIYIDVLGRNPLVVLAAKELSKSLVAEAAKQAVVGRERIRPLLDGKKT